MKVYLSTILSKNLEENFDETNFARKEHRHLFDVYFVSQYLEIFTNDLEEYCRSRNISAFDLLVIFPSNIFVSERVRFVLCYYLLFKLKDEKAILASLFKSEENELERKLLLLRQKIRNIAREQYSEVKAIFYNHTYYEYLVNRTTDLEFDRIIENSISK